MPQVERDREIKKRRNKHNKVKGLRVRLNEERDTKVRARLISLRNEVVEKSIVARCMRRLKIGWSNSISKLTLKPS